LVLKRHSDKKNLIFCPSCQGKSNIIQLAIRKKGFEGSKEEQYAQASEFLKNKRSPIKELEKELKLTPDLRYHDHIKKQGITEETCKKLGIGVPKGRGTMAGCVAFQVLNSQGVKVAYHGIQIKNGQPKIVGSYNPEAYLANYSLCIPEEMVVFTDDIWSCVLSWQNGRQAVCNFSLEYLSQAQIELLNNFKIIDIYVNSETIMRQANELKAYHRFN
jgi:hypothetical protein